MLPTCTSGTGPDLPCQRQRQRRVRQRNSWRDERSVDVVEEQRPETSSPTTATPPLRSSSRGRSFVIRDRPGRARLIGEDASDPARSDRNTVGAIDRLLVDSIAGPDGRPDGLNDFRRFEVIAGGAGEESTVKIPSTGEDHLATVLAACSSGMRGGTCWRRWPGWTGPQRGGRRGCTSRSPSPGATPNPTGTRWRTPPARPPSRARRRRTQPGAWRRCTRKGGGLPAVAELRRCVARVRGLARGRPPSRGGRGDDGRGTGGAQGPAPGGGAGHGAAGPKTEYQRWQITGVFDLVSI